MSRYFRSASRHDQSRTHPTRTRHADGRCTTRQANKKGHRDCPCRGVQSAHARRAALCDAAWCATMLYTGGKHARDPEGRRMTREHIVSIAYVPNVRGKDVGFVTVTTELLDRARG